MTNDQIRIKEIKSEAEMLQQFPLLKQLNPHLEKKDYREMLPEMIKQGYRAVGAFKGEKCVGFVGFWVNIKIWCGKYIEPDNFIVDKNYRSAGVGKMLLDWINKEGKKLNCKVSVLDSYVDNEKSHRFYFRESYIIRGFYFYKELNTK